jgi:hypothetical protein
VLCLLPPDTVACGEMHLTLLDEYENLEIFADVLNNYITNEETGKVLSFPVELYSYG